MSSLQNTFEKGKAKDPSKEDFSTTTPDEKDLCSAGIQTCINKVGPHKGDYAVRIHPNEPRSYNTHLAQRAFISASTPLSPDDMPADKTKTQNYEV